MYIIERGAREREQYNLLIYLYVSEIARMIITRTIL